MAVPVLRLRLLCSVLALAGCGASSRPDSGNPVDDAGRDAGAETDDAGTDAGHADAGPGVLLAACGVVPGPTGDSFAVLDLGHSGSIGCLQKTDRSVVSVDDTGRWLLWRNEDGTRLASGVSVHGPNSYRLGSCAEFLVH